MARATHSPEPRSVPAPSIAPPSAREELVRAIDELVDECRVESLWYLRQDYYPSTDLERVQVLDAIQERSSREVFRRAGMMKAWLSRHSSDGSVSS
jgi:hypothetical protein